ncbi:hypothetical protein L3Y34_009753 [Caenorhabditis briggsae]|uniref:Uncharacterized protein n=1 Tax=Caenorhabditis briggsae TaxID=6238 RepID=A0AAE9D1W8_CAEBR|nr:hypothetical protein L3Y34_009753 [Caenorhabditis briggsae]
MRRSNRERDQATPIYPITYYFYRMIYASYLSMTLMFTHFLGSFVPVVVYISGIFGLVAVNLVHVHHIMLAS